MAQIKPIRILFECNGVFYKFLNFTVSKKDNSFYFHIYRKPGEDLEVPKIVDINKKEIRISSDRPDKPGFDQNKISFHESGYIHTTNRLGERFRDGKIGVPFNEINDYLLLLCISPKLPFYMVKTKKVDLKRDIQIQLSADIRPFLVHFWMIHKKPKMLPGNLPGENMLGGFISVDFNDKDYGIILTLTKLRTINEGINKWPPLTLPLNMLDNLNGTTLLRIIGKSV